MGSTDGFKNLDKKCFMKIAWFTEGGFQGKIPRNTPNMKAPIDWMCAMDADHYNLNHTPSQRYDLGIVVIPKTNSEVVNLKHIRQFCDKVGVMQEGPFWLFQDFPLTSQIQYFNNLVSADIIFTHNVQDKKYYKGLTNHPDVRVLRSVMIEDPIQSITSPENRTGVMIGGNFKSWYGGFDSFMLAKSITNEIYSPQMGRRSEGEEQLGITQLPYMSWDKWISELSKRRIGIHMMRTHAAGTFALNCSYLGIPCIGYEGLDTQRILHPELTVSDGDLETARSLILRLESDKDFYTLCSDLTLMLYNEHYHELKFQLPNE